MDDDLLTLADRLCAAAGMLMEDHGDLAVSRIATAEGRIEKLDTLHSAAKDMVQLIAAARVLARRS